MKRSGHLFGAITTFENVWNAAHKAWRGKRDKMRVASFFFDLEKEILALQTELQTDTWRPLPYRVFEVFEPKRRKIASADFRDRVVHHAIMIHLEPIFERGLIHDTYACRVGKGTHAAVKRAQFFCQRYPYFLKCDIHKYFDSIDHAVLRGFLRQHIKDPRLLNLLDMVIDHPLPNQQPGKGVPIGNLTSQHFANLYLSRMDHFIKEGHRVRGYLRYMDDFLLFSDSKSNLHDLHGELCDFLEHQLGLVLKESALVLSPVSEGVSFLGFRIWPAMIRLQGKNRARMIRKIHHREKEFLSGNIDENLLAHSIGSIIAHMAHADTWALRKRLFSDSLSLG